MNVINVFFSRVFLKFLAAGLCNTALSAAIIFALYNIAGCGYWLSSAAAYIAGAALNFFLNKRFTFKVKEWRLRTALYFALTVVISYLAAYGIAKPAVSWLLRDSTSKLSGNISLFTGMCLYTVINYIGQRFMVFRRNDD
ncbi:MAG: GtrA family protein [Spirochaetaceae bacterium]|jgi:putative flippase GtrA|nr:GtrA family protein [Spirochaetaceae bacterium]